MLNVLGVSRLAPETAAEAGAPGPDPITLIPAPPICALPATFTRVGRAQLMSAAASFS